MFRHLLFRRHVDPALLSIATALLTVRLGPEIVIFGFFAGVGAYLIVGMHRSMRYIDRTYAVGAGLYAAGAVLIGLVHGNLAEEIRWIAYPVYLLLGVLLFPGVILVKDPLREVVIGARAGLILAIAFGVLDIASGLYRVHFGGNSASSAFVLMLIGILARVPVRDPLPLLPNSRMWMYVAAFLVLLTGTRSVLPVFAVAVALDLLALRRSLAEGTPWPRMNHAILAVLIGLAGLGTLSQKLAVPVAASIERTVSELETVAEKGERESSLAMRLVLWRKAADVIHDNPIIGAGGARSMREIKQEIMGEHRRGFGSLNHVHHFILDELRTRGAVGLVLMLGFFGATASRLITQGTPDIREAVTLFLATILLYGSLHGLLVSDRNMALIAIVLSMLFLHLKKQRFWRRVRGSPQPRRA